MPIRSVQKWVKSYYRYKRDYYKTVSKRHDVGIDPILSKADYRAVYTALKNDIKAGTVRGVYAEKGSINQKILNAQYQYKYSKKQARNIQRAYQQYTGERISYRKLRSGALEGSSEYQQFNEVVESTRIEYRDNLIKKGYRYTDARKLANKYVSSTFFGS